MLFLSWCSQDGGRSSSAGIFVGGFVLGGLVVGALACVYAPQVFFLNEFFIYVPLSLTSPMYLAY